MKAVFNNQIIGAKSNTKQKYWRLKKQENQYGKQGQSGTHKRFSI